MTYRLWTLEEARRYVERNARTPAGRLACVSYLWEGGHISRATAVALLDMPQDDRLLWN